MNAEVIGVGTELLLGQIANTNAQRISAALAGIGVDVYRHAVIGDNLERVAEALRGAVERSDAVIVTGGLGPTPDDLTRPAAALAFDRPLARDERLAGVIRGIFARLGREMPEENLRQADLPRGATPIEPEGTAPGFMLEEQGSVLCALPGVPWEMTRMLEKAVIPELVRRAGAGAIVSREILVVGLGESHTHQRIKDLVAAQSNPTIAYLAGAGRVRVRLTAKAPSETDALAAIEPLERAVRARLGTHAVAGGDGSLARVLGRMLVERGETVAVAESLTGGLIAAELTAAAGASEFFVGAIVAYSTAAKRDAVGVSPEVLQGAGAVSEEAAAALAERAAAVFGADLGLAATGVAGPLPHDDAPVGTVYVGASYRSRTEVRRPRTYGDRGNIRALAVTAALDLGRRVVSE